ncbi:response regulator [Paenibacillus sp. SYP-B3998]|uniref:Response regulator n=1 Tax=Paenibacillus sp. SYP-B3998 TaxID=2678564 RepID=A0A6G3ZXM9_9BACL|nr:response regulator [Paenibacillus sp. SYP-B3998]NEW06973.1 response regulator [Paenibacillus sp. SYP-B3998]
MKVLIVDDEKHVRTSIRYLINWESMGISHLLEAVDGTEAISIIKTEQPQLIITDIMMPITTGIELMEWIQIHAPKCKVIVISGYNDFEYVRQTVKSGGVDYLLKPIVQKHLQEAISKALRSLHDAQMEQLQYVQLAMEVNELKPFYKDKLLSNLLGEYETKDALISWETLFREFPALKTARSCCIAILDVNTLERSIREKFESNLDLLIFSLINICNEFIQTKQSGIAFRNWYKRHEIVLILWDDLDFVRKTIEEIQEGIVRTLKTHIQMGIGLKAEFPDGLHHAYVTALKALHQRNLLCSSGPISEYAITETSRTNTLRFSQFEEDFRMAIKTGRAEPIQEALQKWFQIVSAMDHISFDQLEKWRDEYNVAKARWMEELLGDITEPASAASSSFNIPFNKEGNLSLPALEQQIMRELMELSQFLTTIQINNRSSSMREIARFIRTNYNQEISLTDISERFHLNREYISRKFKQEFHETFIDYLNRIRIEKAKMLLTNPNLKIAQIAQMVGYQDEKYFSRVFKKVAVLTPKDYRNQFAANRGPTN